MSVTVGQSPLGGALSPVEPPHLIGISPNVAHQAPTGIFPRDDYTLGIVEFDDQGLCYDRRQMESVAGRLDASMTANADIILVVFVHGWKHNARSDDANLGDFETVLHETAELEAGLSKKIGAAARPVFGIFAAWRGMSLYDKAGIVDNITFWDRQDAGRRVATGSIRELLGRCRHYHNRCKDSGGAPLFIVVGHSFGGMVVYSALAQSLIEAASVPVDQVTPRFADLVLLVNPAFEAARYLPIFDLVEIRKSAGQTTAQPPVFICATATNDWATGWAFPIGNLGSLLSESWRGARERQAMLMTMGHLPWLKTHDLRGAERPGQYTLDPQPAASQNPFWVVAATPDVINGHNDIFGPRFLRFVADRVFEHAEYSRAMATKAPASAPEM